jgi:hypothetical protein
MILETLCLLPPFVAPSSARKALSRVYLMFRYINIQRGGGHRTGRGGGQRNQNKYLNAVELFFLILFFLHPATFFYRKLLFPSAVLHKYFNRVVIKGKKGT